MSDALLLGRNIRLLCDELELITRPALAEAIGASTQSISQLVGGTSKGWKHLNLIAAAKFIGLSAETLVEVDLSKRPDLTDLVAARHTLGTREQRASYVTASKKLADIIDKMTAAFNAGTLDEKGLGFVDQAIEMAVTKIQPPKRN